jgi:hypothetical protein
VCICISSLGSFLGQKTLLGFSTKPSCVRKLPTHVSGLAGPCSREPKCGESVGVMEWCIMWDGGGWLCLVSVIQCTVSGASGPI